MAQGFCSFLQCPAASVRFPSFSCGFPRLSAGALGFYVFSDLERQEDPTWVEDRRREQVDDVFTPSQSEPLSSDFEDDGRSCYFSFLYLLAIS